MSKGLTNGENFLKRKSRSVYVYWDWIAFVVFLILMGFMFYHYVFPLYFYPKVAVLPVENAQACQQIKEGKWSETYQVFKFCETLQNS